MEAASSPLPKVTRGRVSDADRTAMAAFIERHWGSRKVISCGQVHQPHEFDGFLERRDGEIVGLLTMRVDGAGLEIVTLNSTLEGHGIGTSLVLSAIDEARRRSLTRVWLTTTNDNLRAFSFYQRLGFRLTAIHSGAMDRARQLKPEIPEVGREGIPIHDEVVLSLNLQPYAES